MYQQEVPLVSVIVPTLNAGHSLLKLLQTISTQQVPASVELVVIDSESDDGTRELARQAGAKVLVVARRQFNHGRARNLAIQASRGEFLALTVQDAEPCDEQWLARLLAPMLERPELAGTYGLQVARPTSGLLARTRSALWLEGHGQPLVKSAQTPEDFQRIQPEQRLELIRFDNVTSCVRRTVWDVMPFPESDYGEDMAWAKGVLMAGHDLAYVPGARVWHAHERGWLYELRRAYVDGRIRAELVDWPGLPLTSGDVVAIFRRMVFFLRTRRFDTMVDADQIRSFFASEIVDYEPLKESYPAKIYLDVLRFAQRLTVAAMGLCAADALPKGAWIDLFRFATVSVVGQKLGAAAETNTKEATTFTKSAWDGLDWVLGRGV